MQDKFVLMWAKVKLKKVEVTSTIFIEIFLIFFIFLYKRRNPLQHKMHKFVKSYRNKFYYRHHTIS